MEIELSDQWFLDEREFYKIFSYTKSQPNQMLKSLIYRT